MSAAEPSTRIEFAGLPGSGKTTMAHAVVARLAASGLTVVEVRGLRPAPTDESRLERARFLWALVAADPRSALRVLNSCRPDRGGLSAARAYLARQSGLAEFHRSPPSTAQGAVLLVDEGEVQGVLTLLQGEPPSKRRLRAAVDLLERGPSLKNITVVGLGIRPALAASRIAARGASHGRLDHGDDRARLLALEAAVKPLDALLLAAERAGARVLRIDSDDGADDALDLVVSAVVDRMTRSQSVLAVSIQSLPRG